MLAAFSLLAPERLTASVREMLGGIIVKGCREASASPVEDEMRERFAQSGPSPRREGRTEP